MNEDREQLVRELKAWRLNQPYMTSAEAQEQFDRVRRNVEASWTKSPGKSASSSLSGPDGTAEALTLDPTEHVLLAAEPSTPYSSTPPPNATSS